MPLPLMVSDLTAMTISTARGANADSWYFTMQDLDGVTTFGHVHDNANVYTDGDTATSRAVKIVVTSGSENYAITAGDYLDCIVDGSVPVLIRLPALSGGGQYTLYVDSNGHTYTDESLATPAELSSTIDDALGFAEEGVLGVFAEFNESINMTEVHESDENYEEVEDTISFTEVSEDTTGDGETADTVAVVESHVVERGITSDALRIREYPVGVYDDISTIGRLIIDVFDFDIRAIKFISEVEVGCTDPTTVSVRVHYRFGKNEAWAQTAYKKLNKEGVVTLMAAGVEFKLELQTTAYSGFKPDYITVRYKYPDKRYLRGPYARPTNA